MKKSVLILIGLLPLLLIACVTVGSKYNIVHKNQGEELLRGVSIHYGGFRSACGNLGPGSRKHHQLANEEARLPKVAEAYWITADGLKHSKSLSISPVLPKGRLKGDLIFTFDGNDVSVSWKQDEKSP